MTAAVRPFVTAGVALVGASVIAVTPIAPPPPDIRVANPAMRLTAAEVPGVIAAIANIPAYEIAGPSTFYDGPQRKREHMGLYHSQHIGLGRS